MKSRWNPLFPICVLVSLLIAADSDKKRQVLIIARALSYDYSLRSRQGQAIVLGVVHKPGNGSSEQRAVEISQAFKTIEALKIHNLPFKVIRVGYEGAASLNKSVEIQGLDVIYVCEGLESDLSSIQAISRLKKVLTIGSKEEFVKAGLTLGVFSGGDKPSILINLEAAKSESVNFAADLLQLARLI